MNNLVTETTAHIGEHTATVRVLANAAKLTPDMAAQLDRIDPDDLDAFGRIEIRAGGMPETVLIGKDRCGNLAIAEIPPPPPLPRRCLRLEADPDHPARVGTNGQFYPSYPVKFEGLWYLMDPFSPGTEVKWSLAFGELDPNGNEERFRQQIADHDRKVAQHDEMMKLPRILLREG